MPLGRTFNGCYVLTYSAADYSNDSYASGSILNWARRYVRENIEDVRARCYGSNTSIVATSFSGIFQDDRVELYIPFFYNHDVVARAGTLLHESRHQGGKGHDRETDNGFQMDSSWEYQGAWMYNASYLGWFYYYGDRNRTNSALRERARQRANTIIDRCFETHPGFNY